MYRCPVCGRVFRHSMEGWWCPLCGEEFSQVDAISIDVPPRITKRDSEGAVMYIGDKGFYNPSYMLQLSQAAILEIMERLCCWEEGRYTQYNEEEKEVQ